MKYTRAEEKEGYDIHDYTAINFTAAEQGYIIGSNMYATLLALDPNIATNPKLKALQDNPDLRLPNTPRIPGFTAHEETFFPTQNCWIYMIQPGMLLTTRLPVLLLANVYRSFDLKVHIIYVLRDTVDGILRCWFQG